MQPMHADLPTPTWNMPVVQLEQVASPFVLSPSEPYVPAIQAVPLHFAWPFSGAYMPAVQLVQVTDDLVDCLPVAHR